MANSYVISVILKAINQISVPIGEAADSFDKFSSALSEAKSDLESTTTTMKTFARVGDSLARVGKILTFTVTAPIVAFGTLSLKSSMEFGEAMAKIGAITSASEDQLNSWRQSILNTGIEFGKMPIEVANSAAQLSKMFGKFPDFMERMRLVTKAARAGFSDVEPVVNLMVETLNTYGDDSIQTFEKLLSVATVASLKGFVAFDQLQMTLGRALPIAKKFGITFEEIMAMSVELSKLGPSRAGMLGSQLAMFEVGLVRAFGGNIGNVRKFIEKEGGLIKFLQLLKQYSDQGSDALYKISQGSRVYGFSLEAVEKAAKEIPFTLEQLRNAVKLMDESLKYQTEGVGKAKFAWDQFKAAVESVRIETGENIYGFKGLLNNIFTPLMKAYVGSSDGAKKLVNSLGMLAAIIGPITYGAGKLLSFFAKLIPTILMFQMIKWGVIKGALTAFGVAFIVLLPKILLFSAIVAGIVGWVYVLTVRFKDLKFIVTSTFHDMGMGLANFATKISNFLGFPKVREFFDRFEKRSDMAKGNWPNTKPVDLSPLGKFFKEWFTPDFGKISEWNTEWNKRGGVKGYSRIMSDWWGPLRRNYEIEKFGMPKANPFGFDLYQQQQEKSKTDVTVTIKNETNNKIDIRKEGKGNVEYDYSLLGAYGSFY